MFLWKMSTVAEISAAIRRLPSGERWSLLHAFADELWADWDTQIGSDLESGKLDDLINQVHADIQAAPRHFRWKVKKRDPQISLMFTDFETTNGHGFSRML